MSTHKTLVLHPSGENLSISAMQDWHIIVSDDATAAERYAAEEFKKWFSQATGLTLPLNTSRYANATTCRTPQKRKQQKRISRSSAANSRQFSTHYISLF